MIELFGYHQRRIALKKPKVERGHSRHRSLTHDSTNTRPSCSPIMYTTPPLQAINMDDLSYSSFVVNFGHLLMRQHWHFQSEHLIIVLALATISCQFSIICNTWFYSLALATIFCEYSILCSTCFQSLALATILCQLSIVCSTCSQLLALATILCQFTIVCSTWFQLPHWLIFIALCYFHFYLP